MRELSEFLHARLAEDEWFAQSLTGWTYTPRWKAGAANDIEMAPGAPPNLRERLRADVAAKRRIVDFYDLANEDGVTSGISLAIVAETFRHALIALAQPYREHEDFEPSWATGDES